MSKEHCCCGCIHVRTGALIIGSLVFIFGIIGLLASVVTINVIGIVNYAFHVMIGGCILYADRSHKPGGYLPYLIFAAIGIVIYTIFIVFFVIMAIAVPEILSNLIQTYVYRTQHKDKGIDDLMTAIRVVFFFWAAVMAFIDWIAIWFWMVIYRAYQHTKGIEEYDRRQTYQVKINI